MSNLAHVLDPMPNLTERNCKEGCIFPSLAYFWAGIAKKVDTCIDEATTSRDAVILAYRAHLHHTFLCIWQIKFHLCLFSKDNHSFLLWTFRNQQLIWEMRRLRSKRRSDKQLQKGKRSNNQRGAKKWQVYLCPCYFMFSNACALQTICLWDYEDCS